MNSGEKLWHICRNGEISTFKVTDLHPRSRSLIVFKGNWVIHLYSKFHEDISNQSKVIKIYNFCVKVFFFHVLAEYIISYWAFTCQWTLKLHIHFSWPVHLHQRHKGRSRPKNNSYIWPQLMPMGLSNACKLWNCLIIYPRVQWQLFHGDIMKQ